MRSLLFFIFFFVLVHQSPAQKTLPLSYTYPNQEEELSRSVWAITQDKRGIIYLATERGVVEYDGIRFHLLDTPPAYGIVTDSTGDIYVSTKTDLGQLVSDSSGVLHFKSLFHFKESVVKFEDVILVLSKRKVCAVSYLAAVEYDRIKKTTQVYSPEKDKLFSNGFLENDTLYLSLTTKGLCYASNGKIGLAPYGDRFAYIHGGKMNTNLELGRGQRLLVFGPTLIKYFGKAAPPVPFHLQSDFLTDGHLYSSFSVNDHEKVITTINKGAVLFDTTGRVLNVYNEQRRLPWNAIPNGLSDQSGNLWFTFEFNKTPLTKTEAGKDIRIWNKHVGLEGNLHTLNWIKGKVHVGTDANLYAVDADENCTPYFQRNAYFSDKWFEFKRKGYSDKLMAVLYYYNIGEYKNGKMEIVYTTHSPCFASQSSRFPDRVYVLDIDRFGYLLLTGDKWVFHELARISDYNSFVEDDRGVLWFTSEFKKSVVRIVPPQDQNSKGTLVHHFKLGIDLPEDIRQVIRLNGQLLFIASKGVYTFNDKTNAFEPWRNGGKKFIQLLCNTTLLEKDTLNDILHLVSNNSLVSLVKDKHGDTLYVTNPYRRFEKIGHIVGLVVDRQGVVWVAGTDGLISYDRTKDKKNYDLDFQCLIRSVAMGKDSLILGGGLQTDPQRKRKFAIPFGFDKLKIAYAAPFFDKEEETLYAHRLVGRDKEWSNWEKYADREYNDLFEGEYTFEVKAKNIYGKESSISSFVFVVRPPWYRTWWMYTFYLVGFVAILSTLWHWRTRSLREKQKSLEKLVAIRTNELVQAIYDLRSSHQQLVAANKELEASQEELRQGNEELGATNEYLKRMQKQMVENEKMASLGQLTSGIAHEINNPINFISGGVQALEEIQREVLDRHHSLTPEELQQRKQEINDLMKSINNGVVRTSNIIKSLRTFSSPIELIDDHGTVDIKECVQDAVILVRSKLQKANVNLVETYRHWHGAKANPSLIAQVLINLMDNAIYALQNVSRKRTLEVSTDETDSAIIVKVKDNADGIEAGIVKRIFDPFFTTKEVGAGTGLGLWICYSIIEKHSGKISVTSELGKGTEFTITLPKGVAL